MMTQADSSLFSGEASAARTVPARAELEPLDPAITSIQPGGGVCMRLELAWGHLRRWYLTTVRPGYVRRMRDLRQGDRPGAPFEALDPRDVKYFRNQGGYFWREADDPFRWRDHLPFARTGLCELLLMTSLCGAAAALVGWWWPWAALVPAALALEIVWFFRNPRRVCPPEAGVVVAPADGVVVQIDEIPHDDFIGGPAVQIGIFLSVFNVHINRVPVAARIVGLTYRRGKFMNALYAASARENEQLTVRMEHADAPHRRFVVRQIAGALARRIVCWVKPGDELPGGAQFGMIKLGSRTELIVPREWGLEIAVRLKQAVRAGETVMVRYPESSR